MSISSSKTCHSYGTWVNAAQSIRAPTYLEPGSKRCESIPRAAKRRWASSLDSDLLRSHIHTAACRERTGARVSRAGLHKSTACLRLGFECRAKTLKLYVAEMYNVRFTEEEPFALNRLSPKTIRTVRILLFVHSCTCSGRPAEVSSLTPTVV